MKTIILREPYQLELTDTPPPPPPAANEAQLRVRRVGICGTDLHAFAGRQPFFTYPRILGHELALEVLALGDSSIPHDLAVGDLCCVRPYINCGVCDACQRGFVNACTTLQTLGVHRDGGMREIINLPIDKLHKSPTLDEEELALVEMFSIGCHAVRRSAITPGETALVVGVGPIGLGAAHFAHLAGARVIALDVSEPRLAFARTQPAIDHLIDGKGDVHEQLKALIPDGLPTVVFDATGSGASMMNSFKYVAHGGKLVFVGLFQGDVTFNDPEFHRREMTLFASRNATPQDFQQVMAALEAKHIDVKPWITRCDSPEQMIQDFPKWLDPANGVVKAMFKF
ncbi:MAG: zinc-binding alcohol dehydrogenase family protein [Chloroflexi bacterium]|nr:zinc-binding alcohol dehydrogenase family protein [Chloroflexota bacterium]MCC6894601.1 zinc-binding alcohol dehydrogenase family protein [Anaerolineae bacterium]